MKKVKYKSHEALGISFAEHGALLGTRAMLAANMLTHVPVSGMSASDLYLQKHEGAHVFNMGEACFTRDCGSVACIGGTMALIMGNANAINYVYGHADSGGAGNSRPIAKLFYPPDKFNYENITTAQALKAIDNFLTTGRPSWAKVLGRRKAKK